MIKKLSRREFLNLAALGTAYASSGILLAGCQNEYEDTEVSATLEPKITATIPAVDSPKSHGVLGTARGVNPGRVVWVHHSDAARWDGKTGYWWEPENTNQTAVDEMVHQSIRQVTGEQDEKRAWKKMFTHFNAQRGYTTGYQPGEKIAIKINLNTCNQYGKPHNNTFSAPQIIEALLRQLVDNAGVSPEDIVVYDAVRYMPDCIYTRCQKDGLKGVICADFSGQYGRVKCEPDANTTVHWSEDTGGSTTYLPTYVTQAKYLINLAGLKGHRLAGATLCAKNHCGTILAKLDNEETMQSPQGANIHGYIAAKNYDSGPGWTWSKRPMGSYNALVDMMGHSHLGGKTLLYIIDALYATPHQQAEITNAARWQSPPFNGHWTSSLFMSMDGVAIDSVAYDFLLNEPTIAGQPEVMPVGHTTENYLHEAAQADEPDSGTTYHPDGEGYLLPSLGVHEHWDDPSTRRYSRNRGDGEGIELVTVMS